MGVFVNNAVANIRNTPGIITGVIAGLPAIAPNGTIFISIDTAEVYSYDALISNSWVLIGSGTGGGGTPNLEAVLTAGNIADKSIILITNGTAVSILLQTADGVQPVSINLISAVANRSIQLLNQSTDQSGALQYRNDAGFFLSVVAEFLTANRRIQFPDVDGTILTTGNLPDLQQVTNIGEQTTNNLIVSCQPAQQKAISIQGAPGIDGRSAQLQSNDTQDSGFLLLTNKANGSAVIINDNGTSGELFELPNKAGAGGTFAMLSDIPAIPSVSAAAITPAIAATVNSSAASVTNCAYQQINSVIFIQVKGSFTITVAATLTQVEIDFTGTGITVNNNGGGTGTITSSGNLHQNPVWVQVIAGNKIRLSCQDLTTAGSHQFAIFVCQS